MIHIPILPLGLLAVRTGAAGYLVWDTFRAETPKEKYAIWEREALTNCGKIHNITITNWMKKNMDQVNWKSCIEKFINKFFPTIPLNSYRNNTGLWMKESNR